MIVRAPGLGSAFARRPPQNIVHTVRTVSQPAQPTAAQQINAQRAALQRSQVLTPSTEQYSSPQGGLTAQFSPIEQAAAEARMLLAMQENIPGVTTGITAPGMSQAKAETKKEAETSGKTYAIVFGIGLLLVWGMTR